MEEEIIQPIDRELLKSELTPDKQLRMTNKSHNEIYIVTANDSPNVLKEIGRLREIAFREAGGGTGKSMDLDEFDFGDNCYKQLIVWNPEADEIIGGYRYLLGKDWLLDEKGQPKLATSHMFHFSDKFLKEYMPYTVELGRSFVSLEYQNVRTNTKSIFALDNLWDGLGALTVLYPEVKYFFGKMTMYPSYIRRGRDMILYFLKKHFDDKENLVIPMKPLKLDTPESDLAAIFTEDDFKADYRILNREVRKLGYNIPPLVNAYMSLSPTMKLFGTAINPPESVPFRTLKPEKTHSFEVGFDGEFFQHRLHVNATYYKTNTKNQYFEVTLPWESGYKSQFVNAGNVQNQGFELTAGWFQDFGNEFTWSTDLNLSYNDNKIIELFDGIQDGVTVSNLGGAKVILYEGGQYGDLYVRTLKRDESGKLVTETPEGADYQIPVNGGEQNSDLKYMGNMNSKWNMGWNNTFRYKDLTLSMLIDFRIGGKVVSMTEATLDGYGVSERTGRARDRGYVMREGIKFSNVKAYYDVVGATSFNSVYNVEDYVYDATNVRMREISLGYTFRNLFGQSKNLTLAFIARNLFFFYKDAPMDPDVSMGTGNGLQGFDVFNLPTTRSFGLNVKLNF